jgi:hypothetical protein
VGEFGPDTPARRSANLVAVQGLMIAAVVIFATGALLGLFVTAFLIPEPANWWQPALGRVVWQLGGAAFLGLVIAGMAGRGAWPVIVGFAAVGALLCVNPLMDLARGPVQLRGHLEAEIRGGKSIYADVSVRAPDGTVTELGLSGYRVNVVQERLAECDGRDDVELVVLYHLDTILALECEGR